MRVRQLDNSRVDAYEEFLLRRPTTLLFQSWAYQRLLASLLSTENRSMVVESDDGRICAALPLMSREGVHGRVYNSLPYYGSNGGVISDDPAAVAMLISSFNEISAGSEVASATLVSNPLDETDYGALAHDLSDSRIGQFTPIAFETNHAERLMDSFHHKTRNMVRKAGKLGVTVERDEGALEFVAAVHRENMAEIGGRAKSPRFFELVPAHFRAGADFKVYIASLGGEAVAGLLVFYFNRTAEYYTPVVRKGYRDTQALSLTIFSAMTDASREGFRRWNWGGTWANQDGVYRFKKRWGTVDHPYHYYTRLRNVALRNLDAKSLLDAYPDFYVLPFSALQPGVTVN